MFIPATSPLLWCVRKLRFSSSTPFGIEITTSHAWRVNEKMGRVGGSEPGLTPCPQCSIYSTPTKSCQKDGRSRWHICWIFKTSWMCWFVYLLNCVYWQHFFFFLNKILFKLTICLWALVGLWPILTIWPLLQNRPISNSYMGWSRLELLCCIVSGDKKYMLGTLLGTLHLLAHFNPHSSS